MGLTKFFSRSCAEGSCWARCESQLNDRRLIEATFPVAEVSKESVREKNIRRGHLSTLHIWWARLPLASSRSTSYAALVPAPTDPEEMSKQRSFIARLARWESTFDKTIIDEARAPILRGNNGRPAKVLDPFGGGGSIPLEAVRLGCQTYASDYNPVATLVLKAALEYPAKYNGSSTNDQGLVDDQQTRRLLKDLQDWGEVIRKGATEEIAKFYPDEPDGSASVGYIWARTIPCQNPSCDAVVPLVKQFWLVNKDKKKVVLYPRVSGNKIEFLVRGDGYEQIPRGFDPNKGTVARAVATCLCCGSMIDAPTTRSLFQSGKASERILVVVSRRQGRTGFLYRAANDLDRNHVAMANDFLVLKRRSLSTEWGLDAVPDESTPEGRGSGAERAFSVRNYGMSAWGDLFNPRQRLAMITFVNQIRVASEKMAVLGYEEEYRKALSLYLGFVLDRVADYCTTLCRWQSTWERNTNTFARSALPIVWDYWEVNPLSSHISGSWVSMLRQVGRALESLMFTDASAHVAQSSATSITHEDNSFDAVFTDPPYYDNVPYSYLSDFFYVWLRRTVGHLYPEMFATPLTPKSQEIVAYSNIPGGFKAGKEFFESMLKKAFAEIHRVLKPNGVAIVVYAHKSTAGWETLVNSLWDSGLVVTCAWPIHTEMKSRLRALDSAALASSIYMVARKFDRERTGFYREIRTALKTQLELKLDVLWKEGISGADFFISAIGSSMQVFSKFDKILDDEGNLIRTDRLLEDIRTIVADYAVKKVLRDGITGNLTPLSRFYVLWRWAYGEAKLEFDDAKKLAQGVGIDASLEWNKGFIRKDKALLRLLGPEDREKNSLSGSKEPIDILHHALLLWGEGRRDDMTNFLIESGSGTGETLYDVAQAIAGSLPNTSREKKLLEGFLQTRGRVVEQLRSSSDQRKLFE